MTKNSAHAPHRMITVAGCKGGVGKSVIACAIGLELGRLGKDVILVDADLGGPNMHTYLGMQTPKYVISDFLARRKKGIKEIVLDTEYKGVRFISSAGNVPSQANPRFSQKMKIINSLYALHADFVIVDIGAGSSYDVMDFFSMTDNGILVAVPEPTSIINSYGFVKNVLYRRFSQKFRQYPLVVELLKRGMSPDGESGISAIGELMEELALVNAECWSGAKTILSNFMPRVVMNMSLSDDDTRLGQKLRAIIRKYLSVDAVYLGHVLEDPAVKSSARKMIPFSVSSPDCQATQCVRAIVQRLLQPESVAIRPEPTPVEAIRPAHYGAGPQHAFRGEGR